MRHLQRSVSLSPPLADHLRERSLRLVSKLRTRMKHRLLPRADALLLRKRGLIDSVIALLKNQAQIEHARHRSVSGFLATAASAASSPAC